MVSGPGDWGTQSQLILSRSIVPERRLRVVPLGEAIPRRLSVLRGEVVPEDAGGCCPAERAVGSVVIVEVDERVVGGARVRRSEVQGRM